MGMAFYLAWLNVAGACNGCFLRCTVPSMLSSLPSFLFGLLSIPIINIIYTNHFNNQRPYLNRELGGGYNKTLSFSFFPFYWDTLSYLSRKIENCSSRWLEGWYPPPCSDLCTTIFSTVVFFSWPLNCKKAWYINYVILNRAIIQLIHLSVLYHSYLNRN